MRQHEIVFSGFGGQGVMFVGQLLAYAAMDAGLHVSWIPSYGPEMRGGTAHCTVVTSSTPIGSPVVKFPEIAVVFNNPSYNKYDPLVAPGGLLVVNSALVKQRSRRNDLDCLYIPATEMAEELGSVRVTNLILLGGLLSWRSFLPAETIPRALKKHIPEHRRNLLELNVRAYEIGVQYALDIAAAV